MTIFEHFGVLMANKTHFSPASEEGHFYGLVDEGKYLRQSSLYKQILPRTRCRLKTSIISVNPVILRKESQGLSNFSSCSSCLRGEKIREISVNPWLINDLRAYKALYNCRETITDVMDSLQIHLFMQNEPNFQKSQMNVTNLLTKNYEKRTLGESGKNEPKTNPIYPVVASGEAGTNPIYPCVASGEAGSNPKRTQFILS